MMDKLGWCKVCGESMSRLICFALMAEAGAKISGLPLHICYVDDDGNMVEHDLEFPEPAKETE